MYECFLIILFSIITLAVSIAVYLQCSIRMCTSKRRMDGKVVIVTGANEGIGFHTAKCLADRGARVILACRNEARANAAKISIVTSTGNRNVVDRHLDLCSLKSVRQFAKNILQTEEELHVLVNNAGIAGFPDYTEDGIIEELQVNYFGHFLLTFLLLPLLKKSCPSRIINLSSILHYFGSFNLVTLNKRPFFESMFNYCNSKLYMLMFTLELSRRLAGTGVVVNAGHPGVIMTKITATSNLFLKFIFWIFCILYNRTPEQGAQTVEHLAVADECGQVSGKYFVDCAPSKISEKAMDMSSAKQLWEYSEKLVGISNTS